MNFLNLVQRKILFYILSPLGIDNITLRKIHKAQGLIRLGSKYGGRAIPDWLLNENSICYCVGCGNDITFDLSLIQKYGSNVYGFDPTPKAVEYVYKKIKGNPKYHFYEYGLWDKESKLKFYLPKNKSHISHSLLNLQKTKDFIELPVKRLSNIMKSFRHKKIHLLKLDIEGAEYKVINSIIRDKLDIDVICVEYDECFNPLDRNYLKRINSSIDNLIQFGYVMVNSEGNGNYTFVKRNLNV